MLYIHSYHSVDITYRSGNYFSLFYVLLQVATGYPVFAPIYPSALSI